MPGPTCLGERGEPVAAVPFGGEMLILHSAFTATKPGTGERRPTLIHPSLRPHFAANLVTRATLHDYHLEGDKVNADCQRIFEGEEANHGVFLTPGGLFSH